MEMTGALKQYMKRIAGFCAAWLGLVLTMQAQTCRLFIETAAMAQGTESELTLMLTNETAISGGQFTVTLPEGITIKNVTLNDDRSNGHSIEYRLNATSNSAKILFYAQPTAALKGTDGALCVLTVEADASMPNGTYPMTLADVRLASDAITSVEAEATDGTLMVTSRYLITVAATEGGTVAGEGTYDAGDTVTVAATPHTGYHFVKWSDGSSENPYTFKATESRHLTAEFAPNIYTIIYMVDGEEYMRKEVAYGSSIAEVEAPAKEGYTFSGWTGLPETMPAEDITVTGSFVTNGYTLTYIVDGEEYKSIVYEYGAAVTPEAAPTKEGHTFSGWTGLPETMPANDVTVTGAFTVNKYLVTFKIGNDVIAADSLEYGASIVAPEAPAKEGHTFNGWGEVAGIVPANDLTYEGSYSVNSYTLTYIVDGEEYKSIVYEYGAAVTPEAAPTKEGHTFSGWTGLPETMPAKDVTVTGSFVTNGYTLTYIVDGEEYKSIVYEYGAAITPEAAPIKEGYTFGGWTGLPETMPAEDVTVSGEFILNSTQTDAQGLVYALNDEGNAFEVTGHADTFGRELVIPSELYGLPVVSIKEKAFMGADELLSIVIPASVTTVGDRVFYGCEKLLVVEWNTTAPVRAECFDKVGNYGNMLVFVSDASTEVSYKGNVIVDGVAEQVTLTDGRPLRNPRGFVARSVRYTREFTKKTSIGISGGWEAMVLPFDVQTVTSAKGELKPFGEADFVMSLPCWIATMQADGTFADADGIKANVPFIMEVPNSDEYEEEYNIEGEVSFSASDVTVYATVGTGSGSGAGGYQLLGSYEGEASASGVYALNDEEYTVDGATSLPGGVFVADSRDIRPFEAYVYSAAPGRAPYLRIGAKGATDIEHVLPLSGNGDDAWYTLQGVRLDGKPQERGLYIHNRQVVVIP